MLTLRTLADESVDLVQTFAVIKTRRAGALINVNLTVNSVKAYGWETHMQSVNE